MEDIALFAIVGLLVAAGTYAIARKATPAGAVFLALAGLVAIATAAAVVR